MEALLARLVADQPGYAAVVAVFLLPTLDFVLGASRAIANNTFSWDSFSTWVRSQIAGHAVPIAFTLIFAQFFGVLKIGPVEVNVLETAGITAAAAFAATTVKSILDTLNPSVADVVPPPAT